MSIFDVSEGVANTIHTAGNVFVVIGAIFAFLGTIGIFWGGGVRDRFVALRLSGNTTATAKANEAAARANERTASLEKDAATAQVELERLKSKLAWRTITEASAETFKRLVADAPKAKINISYLTNNEEVVSFITQLAKLLRSSGYDAPASLSEMNAFMPIGGLTIGVTISVKSEQDKAAAALQNALKTIGIEAPGRIQATIPDGQIEIKVGAKPSDG